LFDDVARCSVLLSSVSDVMQSSDEQYGPDSADKVHTYTDRQRETERQTVRQRYCWAATLLLQC